LNSTRSKVLAMVEMFFTVARMQNACSSSLRNIYINQKINKSTNEKYIALHRLIFTSKSFEYGLNNI